ncbi:MAG: GTPase ObgE [Candidatus Aminicenantes bacterium]|nr:GTPase ObgE [Candidatus Aminicenantes bacterium]
MFIDQVKISVEAGRGGNGCVSFRREAKVPRGGPDGGRGGNGGSVVLVSESGLTSLAYFRLHPLQRARPGAPGEGGRRQGKRGNDVVLRVPAGTVVKDLGKGEILHDFLKPGERVVVARGGKGGRGNASFATSTHQAPREHEPGRPGEEKALLLELKMIADVGLVGFPNVGKSTLLSKISAARPVIADYPFTTLIPHLGVVDAVRERSFVAADIPGLIEGAHLGHGLGTRFLKHIERTKLLVHVLDVSPATGRDPVRDFEIVMAELEAYNPALARRPQVLAANKADLLEGQAPERILAVRNLARRKKLRLFVISALRGEGIRPLVSAVAETLDRLHDGERIREKE